MDQEIIKPDNAPQVSPQQLGRSGLIVAAIGSTLLALTHLGAATAATIWAVSQIIGLPEMAMWAAMALGAIPVIWATIWTAGRAWHVERRIENGADVDMPVFSLMHYWKKA